MKTNLQMLGMVMVLVAAGLALPVHAGGIVAWGNSSSGQITIPDSAADAVAVAVGQAHSLALKPDGSVVAWGTSSYGLNTVPAEASSVVAIVAGAFHSLVLRADGIAVAWGISSSGLNAVPAAASNVIAIAAGDSHSLALRSDGRVIAWGSASQGQTSVPAACTNVVAIAAGGNVSLALCDDGWCFVWGAGGSARVFRTTANIATIAAGNWQQLALTVQGELLARGAELPPQATNLVAMACSTTYSLGLRGDGRVIGWGTGTLTNVPSVATNVIALAAGPNHCLAIQVDSPAPQIVGPVAWQQTVIYGDTLPLFARAVGEGPLAYYWLADGEWVAGADSAAPNLPALFDGDSVNCQAVVCNDWGCVTSVVNTVFIDRPAVRAWGAGNVYRQTKVPTTITNALAAAAGASHCLVLNSDGTVSAWGKSFNGQTTVPLAANNIAASNIIAIAAGENHSLAYQQDGWVMNWGDGWEGQTNVPPFATNVVSLSAGRGHSLALRGDGTVVAWGNDQCGQREISHFGEGVVAIASGYWHNMALRSDGTVVTSGLDYAIPGGVSNVVAVAAGWEHCLVLRADGSVVAWGDNAYGQCEVPAAATNLVAIACGYFHSVGVRADGSMIAWGREYRGSTTVPPGVSGIASASAGDEFSMAVVGKGAPRFGSHPTSITVQQASPLVLTLDVQGQRPVALQWFHNGAAVPGATNRFLLIPTATTAHSGNYTLEASNALGQASSGEIEVTVKPVAGWAGGVAEWRESPYGRPHVVSEGTTATCAVAAGAFHRLALSVDGVVGAWGGVKESKVSGVY